MYVRDNPFAVMPYRRQPKRRYQYANPMNQMVNGMVTLGSIAIISGTTLGILNAFQR